MPRVVPLPQHELEICDRVKKVREWIGLSRVEFASETWLQFACPLTVLEMWLRTNAHESVYSGSFIAHWLQWLLYYDLPAWLFALGYSLFALLVVAAWLVFPPNFKRHSRHEPSQKGFRHV